MSPERVVPGLSIEEAASRLAGVLAELGETRIESADPGRPAGLMLARHTDLPGELVSLSLAGGGTLRCMTLGLTLEVHADRIEWRADDAAMARAVASRLG